jgi:hypothetical protein
MTPVEALDNVWAVLTLDQIRMLDDDTLAVCRTNHERLHDQDWWEHHLLRTGQKVAEPS